ncbi:MAG TPA: hypothetical protein VNZ86_15005 [Bacteroidia bacterium]|nr:hypothetical protein [Bacteroidia bacterium]
MLTSCSIRKRHYLSGYFVSGRTYHPAGDSLVQLKRTVGEAKRELTLSIPSGAGRSDSQPLVLAQSDKGAVTCEIREDAAKPSSPVNRNSTAPFDHLFLPQHHILHLPLTQGPAPTTPLSSIVGIVCIGLALLFLWFGTTALFSVPAIIVGFSLFSIPVLLLLALILGAVGARRVKKHPDLYKNRWLGILSFVLGLGSFLFIAVGLTILILIFSR